MKKVLFALLVASNIISVACNKMPVSPSSVDPAPQLITLWNGLILNGGVAGTDTGDEIILLDPSASMPNFQGGPGTIVGSLTVTPDSSDVLIALFPLAMLPQATTCALGGSCSAALYTAPPSANPRQVSFHTATTKLVLIVRVNTGLATVTTSGIFFRPD